MTAEVSSPRRRLATRDLGGGVAEVALDRPEKANSLDAELVAQLLGHVIDLHDGETKLLVLRGTRPGSAFCGGFDLDDGDIRSRLVTISALLETIRSAQFATVCCLEGPAIGAGADLAAACDLRLGIPTASFSFPGFSRSELLLGTDRLVELVGGEAALELVVTGRSVDGRESLALGLLSKLATDRDDLESTLDVFVRAVRARTAPAVVEVLRKVRRPCPSPVGDLARSTAGAPTSTGGSGDH